MLSQRYKGLKNIGPYGTLGLDFVVAVCLCLLCGWWLDKKTGWTPWLSIAGIVLGAAAGFNLLYKAVKKTQQEAERETGGSADSENTTQTDGIDGRTRDSDNVG